MFLVHLTGAFMSPPVDFEETWNNIPTQCKAYHGRKGELVTPGSNEQAFEWFAQTIQFQVADLRRMETLGLLNNPLLYINGVTSPADNQIWYNFDACTLLNCGSYGVQGIYGDQPALERPSWLVMALILSIGRIYE